MPISENWMAKLPNGAERARQLLAVAELRSDTFSSATLESSRASFWTARAAAG